jgi:hypothetical protein
MKPGTKAEFTYATAKGIKEGDVIVAVGGKMAVLLRVKSKEGKLRRGHGRLSRTSNALLRLRAGLRA